MKRSTFITPNHFDKKNRRTFIKQSVLLGTGIVVLPTLVQCDQEPVSGMVLEPIKIIGLKTYDGETYLENAKLMYQLHVARLIQSKNLNSLVPSAIT